MNLNLIILSIFCLLHGVIGPPVTQQKSKDDEKNSENEVGDGGNEQMGAFGIEYDRYLKEVVTALESDPEFREKLEKAEEVDIRTGKIAQELEYVNHNVRTKLDEIKRQELERLRHLTWPDVHHLDHNSPTFEVEDLKKLIAKTTADLAEADRKRREEFKEYEMQKQFEREQKLKSVPDEKRHELEEELQHLQEKHKKHEPLHHPGSKQQLEEVWEKQDHMENQEFDPKTFFYLHDLDGNGAWDEGEVKALFLKELDKLYQAGAPEDDMRERREEMERMREHVFKEADLNKDGLISYQEFLQQTQKPDFEKDEGWQSLDEQQIYSPEEYAAFEHRRQQEIQRMIQQGLIPPHPNGLPPPPLPQGHQQFQQPQHFPSVGQPLHPNQIPQAHPGHMSQGQYQGGSAQSQYHPGQVPAAQYHQGQVPHGQIPSGQHYPGQVPQGQFQAGHVPQSQYLPGQVSQTQYQPVQVQTGQQQQLHQQMQLQQQQQQQLHQQQVHQQIQQQQKLHQQMQQQQMQQQLHLQQQPQQLQQPSQLPQQPPQQPQQPQQPPQQPQQPQQPPQQPQQPQQPPQQSLQQPQQPHQPSQQQSSQQPQLHQPSQPVGQHSEDSQAHLQQPHVQGQQLPSVPDHGSQPVASKENLAKS